VASPRALPRLAFAALAAASALFAAACLVDLSGLTGGSPDGGAPDGGTSSSGGGATASASASGTGGAATASSTASGSASTSSASSSSGTGGCGPAQVLDCGACACPGGNCSPIELAMGPDADTPAGIAVSSDGLFWVDKGNGQVMGLLATGGGPQVLAQASTPVAIAAGAGRIFYVAADGLWTCPLQGCDANKSNLDGPATPGSIQSVAFDGQLLFWTDKGTDFASSNGTVKRCAWPGCSPKDTIADNQSVTTGLTLTADSVLWTALGNGNQNGAVRKAPKVGFGVTDVAGALDLPTGIAADDMYVYWTEAKVNGRVLRCVHNDAQYCDTPADIAKAAGPLGVPSGIAVGGARLYWGNRGDGTIMSCPLPGCPDAMAPKTHATGRTQVRHVAVGTGCLFWTDQVNGGTADKLPR
jgi:hypothetical protein